MEEGGEVMANAEYYLQFHHRDWLSSTTILTMDCAARGIYIMLMSHQFEDGSLPADSATLQRLAHATPREWKSFEPFLNKCFPVQEDGTRQNQKVAEQRTKTKAKREKLATNGKAGGRPKRNQNESKTKPNGFEKVNQNETKQEPSGSTYQNKNKKTTNVVSPCSPPGDEKPDLVLLESPDPWLEFVEAYPRRAGDLGKAKAETIFRRLAKSVDPIQIIDGARRYREYCEAIGRVKTEFVKQMPTFLNARGWEEEFEAPDTPNRGGKARSGIDWSSGREAAISGAIEAVSRG
jgi:uncharacterized protein YdaU (DUF1376 family)